ncbi:iron-containing alcohol dehydrogenase, partial [Lactobacillus sp. XV13L]|nr:iron-containing alcohol dehydrogenase [Lactobacillus sp. XV13L]
ANTMLLPYVVSYNAQNCSQAMHKFAVAAKKAGIATPSISDKMAVQRLIGKIREMARQMNCPMTLREFGVDPKAAVEATQIIISNAKKDATYPTNPVDPTDDDLKSIYESIIR